MGSTSSTDVVNLSTNINYLRVLIVILALTYKFLQREKGEGPRGQHLEALWEPIRLSEVQNPLTLLLLVLVS